MPATLHLARFTPRHAVRTTGRLWRGWDALRATPGLEFARLYLLADLDPLAGGTPTPTRWALLCGWEDPDFRATAGPLAGRRLTRDAAEAWALDLDPVRVRHEQLHGWRPRTEGVAKLERDEPLVVMTHGRLRARHVPAFTVANQRIVRAMRGGPGLAWMAGAIDHLQTRATFSLWRSQGATVRFAYGRDQPHTPVQRTAQQVPWGRHWFFTRFRPVGSTGTWDGRDLLADARAVD